MCLVSWSERVGRTEVVIQYCHGQTQKCIAVVNISFTYVYVCNEEYYLNWACDLILFTCMFSLHFGKMFTEMLKCEIGLNWQIENVTLPALKWSQWGCAMHKYLPSKDNMCNKR